MPCSRSVKHNLWLTHVARLFIIIGTAAVIVTATSYIGVVITNAGPSPVINGSKTIVAVIIAGSQVGLLY